MNVWHEILEEAKHAGIAILAITILFGAAVGFALFLHFV
jgi:hypothetical protein